MLDRNPSGCHLQTKEMAAPKIGILTPPSPCQSLLTTQSLKNWKSRARPSHQGCCSGLCLLCYLEAWHSTTCPSCWTPSVWWPVFSATWLFHRCPSRLGQALEEQVEVTPQYMPIVLLQIWWSALCDSLAFPLQFSRWQDRVVILPVLEFHLNQMATPRRLNKSLVLWHIESRGLNHWWTRIKIYLGMV